jgi:hypothetical protein
MKLNISQCRCNKNPNTELSLENKPGVYAIVFFFHGRTSILKLDKSNDLKVAVEKAFSRHTDRNQSNDMGEMVVAFRYADIGIPGILKRFKEDLAKKLNTDFQ